MATCLSNGLDSYIASSFLNHQSAGNSDHLVHLHYFKIKNSPIKGWGGLSKNVQNMSKMSIIEISQLGQDLFYFSDLT